MQVWPCNARGATGACTRQECKPSQNQEAPQTRSFREAVFLRTNTLSSAWRHGVKQGLESGSYNTSAAAENGISQGSSHQPEQAPSVPLAEVTGPHHCEHRSTRRAGCRLWPRGGDELGDHGLHQDGHHRVRAPGRERDSSGSAQTAGPEAHRRPPAESLEAPPHSPWPHQCHQQRLQHHPGKPKHQPPPRHDPEWP